MKKIIIGICVLIVVVVAGTLLWLKFDKNDNKEEVNKNTDAIKFKNEYEKLNGKKTGEADKKYAKLSISENNSVVYSDYDEIMNILEDGTGVIFFGFPECPWCRSALPVLLEAAKETGIDKIYYLNNLEDRDIKKVDDDGSISIEKNGTENYNKLLEVLGENASVYEGLGNDEVKRLYFPTVIFVNNGEIKGLHVSTVESQEDPYKALTKEQREELKNIYIEGMEKTIACDEAC